MTTFTRIRKIAAIGIALVLAAVPTSSALAGTSAGAVGALSVTYAISNGKNLTEVQGVWSKYNASVPPAVFHGSANDSWLVYLPRLL